MPDDIHDEDIVEPIETEFPESDPLWDDSGAMDEPTSFGPASSEAPDLDPPSEGTTPGESDDSNLTLDPRYKDDFNGLMFLGYLTDEFDWAGHRFSIRTLNTDAMLEVALWCKKYEATIADSRAYATAVVAASIELLDGRPLYRTLGPGGDNAKDLELRIAVVRRWFRWTIDYVYSRSLELERRVDELVSLLGKASS
jgi:hypothetical protein